MTWLMLVRHGESEGNRSRCMAGAAAPDWPLSDRGWHQAQALGQQLAQELAQELAQKLTQAIDPVISPPLPPPYPTHIYLSPTRRARQTLQALTQTFPLGNSLALGDPSAPSLRYAQDPQIREDARLLEMDNGIFAGLTWAQAQSHNPDLCAQLERSPQWIPIPRAESPRDCRDRAHSFTEDLYHHGPDDRLWVISHGGILPYLLAALWGSDRVWGMEIGCTARFELTWQALSQDLITAHSPSCDMTTTQQILRFNDRSHWPPAPPSSHGEGLIANLQKLPPMNDPDRP